MPETAPETLDDWIEITSGAAFSSKYFSVEDGLPLVRIRDLGKGSTVTRYTGPYDAAFLLESGDVLIGMDGDFAVERWEGGTALLNQRVCKVASRSDELDQGFLYHFLKPKIADIHRITPETTVRHLSTKDLRKIARPEMDAVSQKLIADILDAIDDAVLETDVLIEKHEAIRLGLLDDLISIPGQIGSSDAPDTLASLVASISSGCSVNADDRPPSAGEFGVLKTSAVGGGRFRPLESKAVWPREVSRLKCPVEAGLILFSRMNTPQLVGENAFVDQDHPGLFLPDRLWAIRVKEDEGILPEWVATILQTRQARAFITGEATGTSGSMKNIARTSLLRLPVRKLPHADQVDAMKAVHALQAEIDALMSEREKLAALRLGLRDDLLTGRKPVAAIREAAE